MVFEIEMYDAANDEIFEVDEDFTIVFIKQ